MSRDFRGIDKPLEEYETLCTNFFSKVLVDDKYIGPILDALVLNATKLAFIRLCFADKILEERYENGSFIKNYYEMMTGGKKGKEGEDEDEEGGKEEVEEGEGEGEVKGTEGEEDEEEDEDEDEEDEDEFTPDWQRIQNIFDDLKKTSGFSSIYEEIQGIYGLKIANPLNVYEFVMFGLFQGDDLDKFYVTFQELLVSGSNVKKRLRNLLVSRINRWMKDKYPYDEFDILSQEKKGELKLPYSRTDVSSTKSYLHMQFFGALLVILHDTFNEFNTLLVTESGVLPNFNTKKNSLPEVYDHGSTREDSAYYINWLHLKYFYVCQTHVDFVIDLSVYLRDYTKEANNGEKPLYSNITNAKLLTVGSRRTEGFFFPQTRSGYETYISHGVVLSYQRKLKVVVHNYMDHITSYVNQLVDKNYMIMKKKRAIPDKMYVLSAGIVFFFNARFSGVRPSNDYTIEKDMGEWDNLRKQFVYSIKHKDMRELTEGKFVLLDGKNIQITVTELYSLAYKFFVGMENSTGNDTSRHIVKPSDVWTLIDSVTKKGIPFYETYLFTKAQGQLYYASEAIIKMTGQKLVFALSIFERLFMKLITTQPKKQTLPDLQIFFQLIVDSLTQKKQARELPVSVVEVIDIGSSSKKRPKESSSQDLRITGLQTTVAELEKDKKELEADLEKLVEEHEELDKEKQQLEGEVSSLRQTIRKNEENWLSERRVLGDRIDASEKVRLEYEKKIEEFGNEVEQNEEKIAGLEKEKENLNQEAQIALMKIGSLNTQIESLKAQIQGSKVAESGDLSALQAQFTKTLASKDDEIDELRNDIGNKKITIGSFEDEIRRLKADLEKIGEQETINGEKIRELEQKNTKLIAEKNVLVDVNAKLRDDIASKNAELKKYQEKNDSYLKNAAEKTRDLRENLEKIDEMKVTIQKLNATIIEMQTKIENLEEQKEEEIEALQEKLQKETEEYAGEINKVTKELETAQKLLGLGNESIEKDLGQQKEIAELKVQKDKLEKELRQCSQELSLLQNYNMLHEGRLSKQARTAYGFDKRVPTYPLSRQVINKQWKRPGVISVNAVRTTTYIFILRKNFTSVFKPRDEDKWLEQLTLGEDELAKDLNDDLDSLFIHFMRNYPLGSSLVDIEAEDSFSGEPFCEMYQFEVLGANFYQIDFAPKYKQKPTTDTHRILYFDDHYNEEHSGKVFDDSKDYGYGYITKLFDLYEQTNPKFANLLTYFQTKETREYLRSIIKYALREHNYLNHPGYQLSFVDLMNTVEGQPLPKRLIGHLEDLIVVFLTYKPPKNMSVIDIAFLNLLRDVEMSNKEKRKQWEDYLLCFWNSSENPLGDSNTYDLGKHKRFILYWYNSFTGGNGYEKSERVIFTTAGLEIDNYLSELQAVQESETKKDEVFSRFTMRLNRIHYCSQTRGIKISLDHYLPHKTCLISGPTFTVHFGMPRRTFKTRPDRKYFISDIGWVNPQIKKAICLGVEDKKYTVSDWRYITPETTDTEMLKIFETGYEYEEKEGVIENVEMHHIIPLIVFCAEEKEETLWNTKEVTRRDGHIYIGYFFPLRIESLRFKESKSLCIAKNFGPFFFVWNVSLNERFYVNKLELLTPYIVLDCSADIPDLDSRYNLHTDLNTIYCITRHHIIPVNALSRKVELPHPQVTETHLEETTYNILYPHKPNFSGLHTFDRTDRQKVFIPVEYYKTWYDYNIRANIKSEENKEKKAFDVLDIFDGYDEELRKDRFLVDKNDQRFYCRWSRDMRSYIRLIKKDREKVDDLEFIDSFVHRHMKNYSTGTKDFIQRLFEKHVTRIDASPHKGNPRTVVDIQRQHTYEFYGESNTLQLIKCTFFETVYQLKDYEQSIFVVINEDVLKELVQTLDRHLYNREHIPARELLLLLKTKLRLLKQDTK